MRSDIYEGAGIGYALAGQVLFFAGNFGGMTFRRDPHHRADTFCVNALQILAQCLQLPSLEFRHLHTALTLRGTNQCGVHELQRGPFAEGVRDGLNRVAFTFAIRRFVFTNLQTTRMHPA